VPYLETSLNQDSLSGHLFVSTPPSDDLSLCFVFIDILGSFRLFSALECAGREYYSTCHCHIEMRPSSQERSQALLDTVMLQR